MKVVPIVWENRISPVADSARQLVVVHVEGRTIHGRYVEYLDTVSVFYRARRIADLELKIFICGAISDCFASLVEIYGTRLIPFVSREVNEVLDAYLEDFLSTP